MCIGNMEQTCELLRQFPFEIPFEIGKIDLDENDEPTTTDPDGIFRDIGDYVGFEYGIHDGNLVVWAEESGVPEHVVALCQAYLRHFDPQGHIGFAWADTCSSMWGGGFGGGAVFITASDAEWLSTSGWLEERAGRHSAERAG
jgi:hypothetical protein